MEAGHRGIGVLPAIFRCYLLIVGWQYSSVHRHGGWPSRHWCLAVCTRQLQGRITRKCAQRALLRHMRALLCYGTCLLSTAVCVSVDIPTKLGRQLLYSLLSFVAVCTSSSARYYLCSTTLVASNCF